MQAFKIRPCWAAFIPAALALAVYVGPSSPVHAQEPFWRGLFTNRNVPADPTADYSLTTEHGPWLIVACTFSDEGAVDQAKQLALELRSKYHMKAYYRVEDFDFNKDSNDSAADFRRQRVRYRRESSREVAVLVGDFSSVDDPDAQRTLDEIKHAKPDALNVFERESTSQNFAVLRALNTVLLKNGSDDRKTMGPMNKAFVAPNPLLPKEYFVNPGVDPLVVKMNDGVDYSLLDCPGNFTVQVATFTGDVILDQKAIQDYEENKRLPRQKHTLEEAAIKAHKLTMILRDKHYEAYEFHDRYCSIVTVGSFATVGSPRADGLTELDPQIYRIMQTFKGKPISSNLAGADPGFVVTTVGAEKIPLDIQPKIVPVPMRSFGASFAGN